MSRRDNEDLRKLGFEAEDIAEGNVGFEIEDMEGYFLREAMENRREQGLDVPEEFQPTQKGRKELDLYRRQKDAERLELERQEDKSDQWAWSDQDEESWKEDCQAKGYDVVEDMDGYRVSGRSIKDNAGDSGLVPDVVKPVIVKNKMPKKAEGEAIMAKETKQAPQAEIEEVSAGQPKMDLLDLSFGRSVNLKGEFKMSKIEKNKKGLAMIRLEGKQKTILISIGGKEHTNLWAGVVETSTKSAGPTIEAVEA